MPIIIFFFIQTIALWNALFLSVHASVIAAHPYI